jgi:FMN phosphatase YigB (HAD superfamily)
LLLERLELRGEEVVFLDDIGSNLSAARRAGIHTIKVADVHTAIGELQVSFFIFYP